MMCSPRARGIGIELSFFRLFENILFAKISLGEKRSLSKQSCNIPL